MKKIITKDDKKSPIPDKNIHFQNNGQSEIEMECGPWHDTIEDAKNDEELFKKDKEAFLKLIKE